MHLHRFYHGIRSGVESMNMPIHRLSHTCPTESIRPWTCIGNVDNCRGACHVLHHVHVHAVHHAYDVNPIMSTHTGAA